MDVHGLCLLMLGICREKERENGITYHNGVIDENGSTFFYTFRIISHIYVHIYIYIATAPQNGSSVHSERASRRSGAMRISMKKNTPNIVYVLYILWNAKFSQNFLYDKIGIYYKDICSFYGGKEKKEKSIQMEIYIVDGNGNVHI